MNLEKKNHPLNNFQGVRIEPNCGFGVILPKEIISLYVIYSPVQNSKLPTENCFDLQVTSLSELCGFGTRAETPPGTISDKSFWVRLKET